MQTLRFSQLDLPQWFSAIPCALVVTLGIVLLMSRLVSTDFDEILDAPRPIIAFPEHVPVVIDTRKRIKPPEKPVVEELPELPPAPLEKLTGNDMSYPGFTPEKLRNPGPGMETAGMPVPQYQVAAKYPHRAIQRNIEGYVDVKFDISAIGTTANVSVVNAVPQGVFDRSAVEAVKRWRYRPRMQNGVAVSYPGIVQRITFVLSDEQ